MDDIQLCKEITRLKKELHKLVSLPGRSDGVCLSSPKLDQRFYPNSGGPQRSNSEGYAA